MYRIAFWNELYEINRTREIKKMTWLPLPNKQDGDGYTELLSHRDGAAHFGAWIAALQVASKCSPRGTLVRALRNGEERPHDAESLSRITRIPAATIRAAFSRLLEIGWLEEVGQLEIVAPAPAQGADGAKEPPQEFPESLDTPLFRAAWEEWAAYRRERKLQPWKSRTVKAKLAELSALGSVRASEAIRHSIANGWQGIFEAKAGGKAPGRSAKPGLTLTEGQIAALTARRNRAEGDHNADSR